MKIISHCGYWGSIKDRNTLGAFQKSLIHGFGIEVDIRDYNNTIIISHDLPDKQCDSLEDLLKIYKNINSNLSLALNIKSDGLQIILKDLLTKYKIIEYFVFDMSIPDTLRYIKHKINIFTRESEYEVTPAFYNQAQGIWADCFSHDWIDEKKIIRHLDEGKNICLVSPELHKRNPELFWDKLSKMSIIKNPCLMICTDYPERVKKIFN